MTRQDEFLETAAKLANFALATGGVLALAIFLDFFYYYSWTGQRQFVGPLSVALYYFCPLTLAILLLASLRFSPGRKVKLVLVCVSVSASVYGTELFVESRFSPDAASKSVMTLLSDSDHKKEDAAKLTKKWGIEIDIRTAGEVIADLQTQGVDALPIITPANDLLIEQPDGSIKSAVTLDGKEILPLAAVSNRVTVLCNEIGRWIDYHSDERGFNNSNEIWHSDRLEIVALGDSYTHGYCVSADRNFVALIRQRYPATLNLGIAGHGPLFMLATLQEYVSLLKPKIVLWFYYEGNDLTDLQRERRSILLRSYLSAGFTQSGRSCDRTTLIARS